MNKKSLLIVMLMLMCFGISKAETIQVGSGTDAQIGMPIYNHWKYGLTQQIYTSSEIGRKGTITSIGFKIMEDLTFARTIDIYLVKTSKSQFSNATDYLSAQESDKVFSGSVSFNAGKWTTITFDKPFVYDGSTNLCLIVNDKTGSFSDVASWLVYSATGQAIFRLNDAYGAYNPASPQSVQSQSTPQPVSYKSQLQLTFSGGSGPESGAGTIQVGSGDAVSERGYPTATIWKYGLTQQIYTIAEIGHTGYISSLAFKMAEGYDVTRNLELYLVKTGKTSFSSSSDGIVASAGDKVFSGAVKFTAGQWATLTFDKLFEYDGSQNLCVIVNDKTGEFSPTRKWSVFDGQKQSFRLYNDKNGSYDPTSSVNWIAYSQFDNIDDTKNQLLLTFTDGGSPEPETTIQVGSGDNSNIPLPVNLNFSHSVSQQIYTAQEIARTGTITTIGFKSVSQSGGATEPQTRYIDLYLVKTNKKEFTSDEDWVSVSESDKVFSGSVTFALDDWTSIRLSKPFEYDGLENLCLVANDKTGSSGKKVYWSVYNDKRETGIYFAGGSSPHNPASLPAADWRVSYKNQLQLTFVGGDSFEPGLEPGVVEINASKTYNDEYLPSFTARKYSLTQQIYTQDEVGSARNLTSISFYNTGSETKRNIDLYLVHTGFSNFDENNRNWINFSETDRVYRGEVTFKENKWCTITFDRPFAYDGTSNLVVIVDDNSGAYSQYSMILTQFLVYRTAPLQSCYKYSDDTNYNPADLSTYTGRLLARVKNKIKLNEEDIIASSSGFPTASSWKYSLTQQIYTQQELGEARDLTSVSFFNTGKKVTRQIDMYLVHTYKSEFNITNTDDNESCDWVDFSAADKVFDGEVTFEANDWTAIRLSKIFSYNGKDNVAIVMVDKTGYGASGLSFAVFTNINPRIQALSVRSDEEGFIPKNIRQYYGTPEKFRNVVRFNEEDANIKPSSIEVSDIEWNSALVTWVSEGSKWNLQYRENRTYNWIEIPGLTSKSYRLESLNEDTYYFVRVQIVGDDGKLSDWAQTGFETPVRFPSPTDLAVSQIRSNSVRLDWKDNCGASSWEIYLYDGENQKRLRSNKPYCYIYDLKEITEYQALVRAVIDDDAEQYSEWAGPADFTTLENNPAPSDIAVEPSRSSATISWKGFSESYEVRYRKRAQGGIYDFDDGTFQGWTTIDADGDGYTWASSTEPGDYISSSAILEGTGFADSYAFLLSGSYVSIGHHALTPDNYLVSPLVELGGNISFYVRGQDANYANEHFGVAVSTASNTDPNAFTLVDEWTLNANGTGSKGTRRKAQGNWGLFTVDLSAYAGKQGYVAIRHFNCTDQFILGIDDIVIAGPGQVGESWISVETASNQLTLTDLQPESEYEFNVTGKMEGYDDASSPINTFTTQEDNSIPYDIEVAPDTTFATLSWKGNSEQYMVCYRPEAGEAVFFEDFEGIAFKNVLPEGWTSIDSDNDGFNWYPHANWEASKLRCHSGIVSISSNSFDRPSQTALNPDNWLISPQLDLQGTVRAWLIGQDPERADEHFAFYVSTASNPTPSDFVQISDMFTATNEYKEYTADLSAYAGQKGYVAIRHFNVSDKYMLSLDDFGIYKSGNNVWKSISTSDTETTIEGLKSNTRYELMIMGLNDGVVEASTGTMKFATKDNIAINLYINNSRENLNIVKENDGFYLNVILVDRTLKKDGKWQTLCLPFDVDIENSPLAGAEIRTAESVTIKDGTVIVNCLTPVTKFKAGVPYIVRWKEGDDIEDPVFEKVTIRSAYNNVILYNGEIEFRGEYSKRIFDDYAGWNRVMVDGNPILAPCDDGTIINAFDAYFYLQGNIFDISYAYFLNTGEEEELITGVSSPKEPEAETIYNLAGMRLSKMQKGINIVNGKKVLVK